MTISMAIFNSKLSNYQRVTIKGQGKSVFQHPKTLTYHWKYRISSWQLWKSSNLWRLFFGIIEVNGRSSTMKGRRKEVISIISFVDDEISVSHLNGIYHGDLGHGDMYLMAYLQQQHPRFPDKILRLPRSHGGLQWNISLLRNCLRWHKSQFRTAWNPKFLWLNQWSPNFCQWSPDFLMDSLQWLNVNQPC